MEYRQNSWDNNPTDGNGEKTKEENHGNTSLPFGLCAKYGIGLPKNATPRDAWNALAGKGIYPPWAEKGKSPHKEEGSNKPSLLSNIRQAKTAAEFHGLLKSAKASIAPKQRWRVDLHPVEEYEGDRLFVSKKGSCVAIEPSGNIISVCKNEEDKEVRGRDLLRCATANGGDRLDAFGKDLYKFYTKNGFEPVSWTPFNEEYAPDEWNKERDIPEPIIFYKYTGKQPQLSYEEFLSSTKPFEGEDGYYDAQKYRDKNMEGRQNG